MVVMELIIIPVIKILSKIYEWHICGTNANGHGVMEFQTLPPDALEFTESEMKDVISFMESLVCS